MTKVRLTARLVGSSRDIEADVWNACANPLNLASPHPFSRYEFFEALEASGSATPETGWRPLHLVVERDGQIAGLMPLYLKSHSLGEYVFDHAWADALERAGGTYYPKLQACVPFTPVTGRRLLIRGRGNESEIQTALLAAGGAALEELRLSSLHITFLTKQESETAKELGYLERTDRQFHWENRSYDSFDDFLAQLSSSRRKTLRKERASVRAEGIDFDWLTGADITEAHWDHFFAFYMDTGNRKWGQPYLTREFFSRVGQTMSDQILLVMARRAGKYIAGALNFFGNDVLYGRNWGCTEYVPFLHFEACYYQAIEFAITRKLARVEAGAQGEHKLLRGYAPVPTYSAHLIVHAGLRRAVAAFLEEERQAVQEEIVDSAFVSPFRNGAG